MNQSHGGEIGDPIIVLGNERDELLKKLVHLSKQWRGTMNVDPEKILLTVDLQAEVENDLAGAYVSLHAVEQKIAEISATTPVGLRVKLRVLAEIFETLVANTDRGEWSQWAHTKEDPCGEPSESFDDLNSRSLPEIIELAALLARSASTDIEQLID